MVVKATTNKEAPMRILKKLLTVVLSIMVIGTVAANGQKDNGGGDSNEPVTITWHQIGNPQDELPVVLEEVNKYLADSLGVKLDIQIHGWGDYTTKMQTMHAAGEPFDLAFTSNWANPFIPTASKGAYYPVDELLETHGQDILATLSPDYWEAAKINGEIMAIINLQIMSNQRGIAVVKEYADKYGFDPTKMKTNSDIFDFFKTIKEEEDGVMPYFGLKEGIFPDLNSETSRYYDSIIGEDFEYIAVDMGDEDCTVFNAILTDEYRRNVESVRYMLEEGYLPSDFTALDLDEEVKGREYASFVMTRIKPGVEGENKVRYGKDTYVFGLFKPFLSTGSVSSTMTAIGINSKHPEKAMELYNAVYSDPKLYNLLVFGIPGVHYTDDGNGYVEQNPERPYGLPAWQFGNQFNAKLLPGQEADVWEQTIALDATADSSPLLGFVFDPTPVKNEVAACNAIYEEYRVSSFYAEDLDTVIEDFNDNLSSAGVDKIIVEAQRQIDAWKNN